MSTSTPPGRLRLTGYAAAQVGFAVPSLLLFILFVVGGVLVLVWVGIGILLVTIPASRWVADRHRNMAGRVLGTPVPPAYRPTDDSGPLARLRGWAADPMTWRDQAWLLVSLVVGLPLALVVLILLLGIVTSVLWWWGVEPIMRMRSHVDRLLLTYGTTERLEQRVQVLTETRAETLDHSAAELRRIERDLHDGAQARP